MGFNDGIAGALKSPALAASPSPNADLSALLNVHLDDSRPGAHEHLQFGEGALDLDQVFGALTDMGYEGPANVELPRHSHAAPAAARAAYAALSPYLAGWK